MDTAEKLKEKIRQRRRAIQQSFATEDSNVDETEASESISGVQSIHSTKSWVDSAFVAETSFKVRSEIHSPHDQIRSTEKDKQSDSPTSIQEVPKISRKKGSRKAVKEQEIEVIEHDTSSQSPTTSKWFSDEQPTSSTRISDVQEIQNISSPLPAIDSSKSKSYNKLIAKQSIPLVQSVAEPLKTKIKSRFPGKQDSSLTESAADSLKSKIPKLASKEDNKLRLAMKQKLQDTLSAQKEKKKEKKNQDEKQTVNARQLEAQNRWKSTVSSLIQDKNKLIVTEEEAYDFFTRVWQPEEPRSPSPTHGSKGKETSHPSPTTSEKSNEIEVAEHKTDSDDTARLLVNEYIQMEMERYLSINKKAIYIPLSKQVAKENEMYFIPANTPVPTEGKISEGMKARDLEAEGHFVGKRPFITAKNTNILEHRYLKQQRNQWFGDDGKIIMQPDPYRRVPCRPPTPLSPKPFFNLVYKKAIYVNQDNWPFNKGKSLDACYRLDLDISSISFAHHPLFSKEHVLVARLVELVQSYNGHLLNENGVFLSQRLEALRSAVEKLKSAIAQERDDNIIKEKEERLLHYQNDIRQIRKLRDAKDAENKLLMHDIHALWERIKKLRSKQEYTNSPINLVIHEKECDLNEDEEKWEKEIQEEYEEEKAAFQAKYEEMKEHYEAELEKWRQSNKTRKQALRRQKSREKLAREGDSTDNIKKTELAETEKQDMGILSEEEIIKPTPPDEFDNDEILRDIQERAKKSRRKPGEPRLLPELKYDGEITSNFQCPKSEQARRNEVSKTRIYFKIFFNDKEVCQTSERTIGHDFSATWGQIFNLCIVHWPQSIKIQIFEKNSSGILHIANVWLPVPDESLTTNSIQLSEQEFGSVVTVKSKHTGVGSGVSFFYIKETNTTTLWTNGVLKCSLAWGVDENGKSLGPAVTKELSADLRALREFEKLIQIISTGLANIQELCDWVEQCHLDPNDPANSAIFQAIHYYNLYLGGINQNKGSVKYFRLEPLQSEFDFVTDEELNNNARFRLLQLRSREATEFRNYNMIPAYENEIPKDVLQTLEQHDAPTQPEEKDVGETQREKASKLLKQIREQLLKRFYAAQHERVLEDVVIEEEVPSIETLGFSLVKILQTQRPLCPVRKERKKMTGQTVASTDVKVIVTVLHALNVPIRVDNDTLKGNNKQSTVSAHDSRENRLSVAVRPFVEVMFQREIARTHVNEGSNPTWNQELCLSFKAPGNDFSPSSLETVRDIIYLSLFDEVEIDLLEDDRDRDSTIHKKLERHWLGDLKIPFTTLYLNSKIEGTFCLNVPPVLLGYDYEPRPWLIAGSAGETDGRHTYLSLFLTIEPCLQLPDVFRHRYESLESERILQEVELWNSELSVQFPKRSIRTMAINISGKWVLIPRYLVALKPPDQIFNPSREKLENMEILARFVSLIPTESDSVIFPGICDIWSTCDQFLQMLTGDEEEHAVLLCNYFLYMEIEAMLLIGSAVPEGLTVYVVTWDAKGDTLVWNASLGQYFSVSDSHSPLRHVYCIVSPDNIWANIQRSDIPTQMLFDLSVVSNWRPFFHKKFPNPGITTVQPSTLIYTPPDLNFAQQLQESLENTLKDNIMKWRRRFRTSWNRHCIQALRNILPQLEKNSGRTASMDSLRELEQILTSYRMCGFPLTMPYTDKKSVVDAVYATGVHMLEGKDVEFALAVYVHPYPCSALAIWVYVAALFRR